MLVSYISYIVREMLGWNELESLDACFHDAVPREKAK